MHEINLLPPLRRQTLRREVTIHSLITFLTSLLYALGAITAIAGVLLALLWGYRWRLDANGQQEVEATVQEYQALREEIATHNLLLEYVRGLSANRFEWSTFLSQFLATIPPGVEIVGINGNAAIRDNIMEDVTFTFNGQAAARGTLIIFADRLRLLPTVTQVEAPNSNLIQRENPIYRFTLQLDRNKTSNEKDNGI